MESAVVPECLEKIFLNLFNYSKPTLSEFVSAKKTCDYEIKDLYTCTLVSRYWCQVSTPLLYSYPFHLFRHLNYKKPKSEIGKDVQDYYKLIRTLLICIPQSEIEGVVNSTCTKESSTPISYSPTFNYVTFLRELHFDDKFFADYGKQIWMPSYIPTNSNPEVCHLIINHLVEYLCRNCNNLTKLEFLREDLQIDLMELLSENKVNVLKELYCTGKHNLTKLYTTLSTTTSYLELFHNNKIMSLQQGNALSLLISAQKKLKHIILSEDKRSFLNTNISGWYKVVFNSLPTQKEWLEKLEFIDISFDNLDQEALNSLCSLKNLKELKLERCRFPNCNVDLLRLWGKSLSNLRVLEYKDFSPSNFATDFELLTIIIQSSSSTLTKLVLDYMRSHDHGFRLLKDILPYLSAITHLKLPGLFPPELTTLFKSCTELVYLSTTLSYGQWDESLRSIGRLVPNSVQKIQFRDMQSVAMNSETLKYFLESCVNKGGKLKCLEIIGKCKLDQEHFDVAKQLEVQLIKL